MTDVQIENELKRMCRSKAEQLDMLCREGRVPDEDEPDGVMTLERLLDEACKLGLWVTYSMPGHNYAWARIAVTVGGPGIYIDTGKGVVEGHWGTESAWWGMAPDTVEVIDDYVERISE